ncbi:MAG: c-type cytochrome [Methylococcaceae bacterium]|nr:c-type cytochrome [Methylococcaceae bacterium]
MKLKKLLLILSIISLLWCSSLLIEKARITEDAQLLEAGKSLYREGVLTNGQPLNGISMGEIVLTGAQAACVNCHRRSGMGASEAGQRVLPITGAALYQPGPPSLWYQHNTSQPNENPLRPAYTDSTLAKAIHEGITPTGRTLQPVMPRFNLNAADRKALLAYLKSLSNPSLAVDADTIHWATVITPDANPAERSATLDLMAAFFKDKNAQISNYLHSGHIPPNRGYAPLRKWVLHVWELQGEPETWGNQLTAHFNKRPVLAVLAGVGGDHCLPVHTFCENQEVACLFPNTNVPPIQDNDFYSRYFSKGLTLEAEVLAEFLRTNQTQQPTHILQVYRQGLQGEVPATIFRQVIQPNGNIKLGNRQIAPKEKLDTLFWHRLIETERPDALVLWLREQDLASLDLTAQLPHTVYLSGHLLKGRASTFVKPPLNKVYLISPWEPQQANVERFIRMREWMEDKNLQVTDELLQGNILWFLWLLDDAVEQITHHFSSDYLIERIEDITGDYSSASPYPRISLGLGQRFAAKGCYILALGTNGQWQPIGNLIVPP